jgi:hypothetical protein
MQPLLVALVLAQGPGPGLTAAVNDPQSHGVVGDNLLSLDEAIRVANGTLMTNMLSAAEQARITGPGMAVDTIAVDQMVTPTITLQAPLSDLTGMGMGHHVEVMGMPMAMPMPMPGMSMLPVIQGGAHARVFTLRTHDCAVHGLRIVGGQVAIDAKMAMATAMGMPMAEVMDCELAGQTVAGVKVHGVGMDESMLMLEHVSFSNMPLGILIDDQVVGGESMVEAEHCMMDGVQLGCRVLEGGVGARMSMLNWFRSTFMNGATFSEKRRTAASTQQFMYRIVHSDLTCTGDVLDVQGGPNGLTMVHHHHGDFVAGAGRKAFWVWPRTAEFDIHGSEMTFVGDVLVSANLASMRVWQQNNTFRNGTVTYDVDGALPNLRWNRYENCALVVPTAARSPVTVRECELVNTTCNGASFLAPLTLLGSWRSGGGMTGFAAETSPAPGRFLGVGTISPAEPQLGSVLTFQTDLPPGVLAMWDIALSFARPTTTMEPVRFYGDPNNIAILPMLAMLQTTTLVPIPSTSALIGIEFYGQSIAFPLPSHGWMPAYHLPRGQRIAPRM